MWTSSPLPGLLQPWQFTARLSFRVWQDVTQPETAYPQYEEDTAAGVVHAKLEGVYLKTLQMPQLVEKAKQAVLKAAAAHSKEHPEIEVEYVILNLPCTFFMLQTATSTRLVAVVTRALPFAAHVHALADKVCSLCRLLYARVSVCCGGAFVSP